MHSNITNKPTQPSSYPNPLPPQLHSNKRAYSFSQSYDSLKQDCDCINSFMASFQAIEEAHNISLHIPYVVMMNCQDQELINKQMQANSSASKPIRERMSKYSQLIQYYSQGCPYLIKNQTRNHQQQINVDTKSSLKQKQVEEKSSSTKKLITSRYVNTRQQQLSSNKQPISGLKMKQTSPHPYHSRSRSISSSHASNSKAFHKIQLKSVKRLDKKDSNVHNITSKIQQAAQSRMDRPENKKQEASKRYTISRREQKQKQNKTLSSQVSDLKNSRQNILNVSRLKSKSIKKSDVCESSRVNSKNRHKKDVDQQQIAKNRNEKNKTLYDIAHEQNLKTQGPQYFLQRASNSIISQTVQKSTDFLNMLKMMSEKE